ncbi:MAG TPA: 30S ribosomal protein S11, partial [Gemmatimonadales bacterium]|nr:30S ribosomal protein S11 [Gemmatimonadales bacterium]
MADEKDKKPAGPPAAAKPADAAKPGDAAKPAEGAKEAAAKKGPRKAKKLVPRAVCHIQASFNNTIITISDPGGETLCWASSGT